MSDIIEYKCPACGGTMEFNSRVQKLKCPFCDTETDVEAFQGQYSAKTQTGQPGSESTQTGQPGSGSTQTGQPGSGSTQTSQPGSGSWEAVGGQKWQEREADGMRLYICKSCGGEIIAEEITGAASCPFCGSAIVMEGQFTGDLKPDFIIPFQKDKKQAKEAYHAHLEGKPFLPKVFKDESHIDEIRGVYVPFWVFDVNAGADITYHAQRIRTWREGDTELTETQHYQVRRAGSVRFAKVPADCSKKMDDTLMESIEPYQFSQAVPFQPAYLAGYVADRYDVEVDECIRRAKERIKKSTEAAFANTVTGYEMVVPQSSTVDVSEAKYRYVLYPVWLLNTTWNGKKFSFAMNGQTGKMTGDLPSDSDAFWRYVLLWSVIIGPAIYLIAFLLVQL